VLLLLLIVVVVVVVVVIVVVVVVVVVVYSSNNSEQHSNRAQTHQQQTSRATDDRQPRQQQVSSDYRLEFTEYTMREKIANKWNALKTSCWRRRESMQLEESTNSEAAVNQPGAGVEIFTVSGRVSAAAETAPHRLTVNEAPPRVTNSSLQLHPGSKHAPVLVGEVALATRSGRENDENT